MERTEQTEDFPNLSSLQMQAKVENMNRNKKTNRTKGEDNMKNELKEWDIKRLKEEKEEAKIIIEHAVEEEDFGSAQEFLDYVKEINSAIEIKTKTKSKSKGKRSWQRKIGNSIGEFVGGIKEVIS